MDYGARVMPPDSQGATGGSTWEPGTTVGRYSLLTIIATGGMAEIWLARQSGLQGFEKLVVIKRMTNGLEKDPDSVQMFLSEARLAAQLSHPHVVQIYELGEHFNSLYIVMEYLDGEDLASIRRTGQKNGLPLMDQYAAKLVAMASEGLHYAHTKEGIDGRPLHLVHRDVSPQNLIATFSGNLKVVDFGIAKAASETTNSGKLKGKLAYMSPEQARGEGIDARSDVFSLGIVLFELVTRTRLLPRMGDVETLTFLAGQELLPRPSERRPDVDPGLEAIVLRALDRKRENRFQSARELQEALEGWIRQSGKSVSSGDIADYLRTLFAKRIAERQQFIETAMRTDLSPSSVKQLADLAERSSRSSSNLSSRALSTGSRPPQRSKKLLAAIGVMIAVVSGIAVTVFARPRTVEAVAPTDTVVRPPVVAEVLKPTVLIIDSNPPGATLMLDGVAKGFSPMVEEVSTGQHLIEARLEGYQLHSRTIDVESAGDRLRIELALVPLPAPVPVKPVVVAPVQTPAPAAKNGRLSLKTSPWTQVFLGKKKLGDTPLIGTSLPAGKHTLRLISPETNQETSIEVEIKANETTVKKLKL